MRVHYESAPNDEQMLLRKAALVPRMDAEMPEPYRLWRTCERHGKLFWQGGIADQPHILMLEFEACESARNAFTEEVRNMMNVLKGVQGGNP